MQDNSFIKRPGTTDRGKEYEDLIVATVALQYIKNDTIRQFHLSSNHSKFGAFDDVVIEAKKSDGTETNFALQLKHVTKDEGSMKNKLSGAKGNFSIQKYFEDFKKTNEKSDLGDFSFALFTNHKFDPEEGAKLTLHNGLVVKILRADLEVVTLSDTRGRCFQFAIEGATALPDVHDYERFFEKFFLFTNQPSVDEVQKHTIKTFREMFSCDNEQAEQFLNFITDWSKSEGKKHKLNEGFIRDAIGVHLLTPPTLTPFSFDVNTTSAKVELFKSLISDYDVTFIDRDRCDGVRRIWSNLNSQLGDFETVNKVATKYRLVLEPAKHFNDLSEDTKSKLLWLLKQHPIIADAKETTYRVVDLCPDKKFILVGDWLCREKIHNLRVLHKLSDLNEDCETYKTMLTSFSCALRDNQTIPLQALFELNSKIKNVITTNELLQMATDSFKMAHVVQLLALSDPDTNAMCQSGYTPLHVACIKGDHELVELIIKSDIDLNGASKDGDSPTILATQHSHHNIVKLLLKCNANVNAADKDGYTAVQMACTKGDYAMVEILGNAGANINAADKDGIAPLQVVASKGDHELVQLLLKLGANVNGANMHGETATYLACLCGHPDVVKMLMAAGAKNVSNEVGNSGLHAASLKGHWEVVKLLLEVSQGGSAPEVDYDDDYGALLELDTCYFNVNAGNVVGDTPLHLAAAKGHVRVVEVLKENGADVSIRNRHGLSALDLARRKEHAEIVDLLT